mgnify:CR=1 FL=1|jgi:hypothetical protein
MSIITNFYSCLRFMLDDADCVRAVVLDGGDMLKPILNLIAA